MGVAGPFGPGRTLFSRERTRRGTGISPGPPRMGRRKRYRQMVIRRPGVRVTPEFPAGSRMPDWAETVAPTKAGTYGIGIGSVALPAPPAPAAPPRTKFTEAPGTTKIVPPAKGIETSTELRVRIAGAPPRALAIDRPKAEFPIWATPPEAE